MEWENFITYGLIGLVVSLALNYMNKGASQEIEKDTDGEVYLDKRRKSSPPTQPIFQIQILKNPLFTKRLREGIYFTFKGFDELLFFFFIHGIQDFSKEAEQGLLGGVKRSSCL